jgi:hypothetical protein
MKNTLSLLLIILFLAVLGFSCTEELGGNSEKQIITYVYITPLPITSTPVPKLTPYITRLTGLWECALSARSLEFTTDSQYIAYFTEKKLDTNGKYYTKYTPKYDYTRLYEYIPEKNLLRLYNLNIDDPNNEYTERRYYLKRIYYDENDHTIMLDEPANLIKYKKVSN